MCGCAPALLEGGLYDQVSANRRKRPTVTSKVSSTKGETLRARSGASSWKHVMPAGHRSVPVSLRPIGKAPPASGIASQQLLPPAHGDRPAQD